MQAKFDTLTREVFDLQETINWKDKKIGVGSLGCSGYERQQTEKCSDRKASLH